VIVVARVKMKNCSIERASWRFFLIRLSGVKRWHYTRRGAGCVSRTKKGCYVRNML